MVVAPPETVSPPAMVPLPIVVEAVESIPAVSIMSVEVELPRADGVNGKAPVLFTVLQLNNPLASVVSAWLLFEGLQLRRVAIFIPPPKYATPVVVAPPEMVRPPICVPSPMVDEATDAIPVLNLIRVEVAFTAEVPKVDGVNQLPTDPPPDPVIAPHTIVPELFVVRALVPEQVPNVDARVVDPMLLTENRVELAVPVMLEDAMRNMYWALLPTAFDCIVSFAEGVEEPIPQNPVGAK